ncbi:MAG: cation:proton antiporter [Gemmatimonadaceae bacterium]|nr:cation:proton antiporter [Gemmatimonadaceae bacterium]
MHAASSASPTVLADLSVLLALGVAVVLAVHRLRLPPIVGFLITGILSGPYGFGLIRNVREVEPIAEIGVILLLFTVGLEFSLPQLFRLRTLLLAGGGLQVALTLLVTALLARAFAAAWPVAIFVGMLVALSSTAIVLRLLADRGEMDSLHGRAALVILIFQDLCVVPMVLVTPLLGGHGVTMASIAIDVLKAVAFVAAALLAARVVVPRVLHAVAATRKRELFLLTVVLLCLGTAWASARVGLSLALGAFIAGLVIAESEYSHQALGEMLPLREVFNSLFFISIGMLFDVRTVLASPLAVLGALAGVVALKALVTSGVALALGQSLRVALGVGLSLAQIGEFSFVLSTAGTAAGLLTPELDQLFLAVAVGTMALTPALVAVAPRLATLVEQRAPRRWVERHYGLGTHRAHDALRDHVIIVGFGFNGRHLARVLRAAEIPYVVVDANATVARRERLAGEPIIYGDATSPQILLHAGIEHARVMVIAISDAAATRATVALARRLNPRVHTIVRAHYMKEIEELTALGTSEVIPEEFETAIEIFTRVLRRYLVPRDVIERAIREVRGEHYEMFRTMPDAATRMDDLHRFLTDVTIAAVRVAPDSAVAGARIADARLRERTGVSVLALQRHGGGLIVSPTGDDELAGGDTVLLLGRPEEIAKATALLHVVPAT